MEVSIRDTGHTLKGEKVHVSMELDNVADSTIDLFYGICDEVQQTSNSKEVKIVAYDYLYSAGNTNVADWYNGLTYPITLADFRASLFQELGLTCAPITLVNDSITVEKQFNPTTFSAIGILKSICQINGVFGIINDEGKFEFINISTATPEAVSFYREVEYQAYTVDPVDKLTIRTDSNDTGVSYGSGNNNYVIQGNMFAYGKTNQEKYDMAHNIYDNISSVTYIPFTGSNNGMPWLRCGDKIKYSIYDFEASDLQDDDVYVDVTFTICTRHLSGIQNLIDEFSAKGEESQTVFITEVTSDVDGRIDALWIILHIMHHLKFRYIRIHLQ